MVIVRRTLFDNFMIAFPLPSSVHGNTHMLRFLPIIVALFILMSRKKAGRTQLHTVLIYLEFSPAMKN